MAENYKEKLKKAEKRIKDTRVDYTKVITPAKSNFKTELSNNKKLKNFDTPVLGRVNSFTPLAARQNEQLVRNQQSIANLGAGTNESIIRQAEIENANINTHNLNVERKMEQERLQREAELARKKMEEAQWALKNRGGNPGGEFSMDGIGGDGGSILGMKFRDPRGNTGTIGKAQADNIARALEIATARGESDYAKQVMIATMMAESGARNLSGGDRDSAGLFQQRPSQGWGSLKQVTDVNYSVNKFLDALEPNLGKGGSGWMDAQRTQRSAYRDGSNYKVYWSFAQKVVSTYANPVASSVKSNTKLDKWINTNVGKYHDYDRAYGTQCVDLFRYYLQYQGRGQVGSMGGSGGAKELWGRARGAEMSKMGYKRISSSGRTVKGDIAVFDGTLGSGYGHVGIVVKDNGDGTVMLMNSNSSTVGNGKATNIVRISKKGLLGYWRP